MENLKQIVKLVLKGIVLGIANVIPGVSGGTMAVVFNVYDKIIELITPDVRKILAAWKFWLPLGIGMAAGILAFSKIITELLSRFPIPTTYFFIGLIIGSIPLIIRKLTSSGKKKPDLLLVLSFLFGLALVLSMIILGSGDVDGAKEASKAAAIDSEQTMTAGKAALIFISGAAAAVAMIIPGISGSFLLLALGMYGTVMAAISRLDVIFLIPFALGVLVGLVFGAALVRFLMKKAPAHTYAAILGLVAGSVVLIYPGFAPFPVILVSAATLVAGFAAAYFSSRGE